METRVPYKTAQVFIQNKQLKLYLKKTGGKITWFIMNLLYEMSDPREPRCEKAFHVNFLKLERIEPN